MISRSSRFGRWWAAGALALAVGTASAATIQYNDFSSISGLTLNGSAAQAGNVLRLTPATDWQSGSFFSTNKVSLAANASFSTYFQFRFTDPDQGFCDSATTCGADGIVFTVQTVSNNVGGAGGGIGYAGIPNSVGIEFDSWNNGSGDNNSSNHVGLDVNGSVNSIALAEVTEADMNNGQVWNVWIDYNGATQQLEVRMGQSSTRPAAALLSAVRDLAVDLGSTDAFVGFTAGTGASHANHDLLSWQLENRFAPIGTPTNPPGTVPEPMGLALLALALTAAAAAPRLRRR